MRSIKEIMRASTVLDANGIHIGGSDRESNHHYGDAYESLFPDRANVKLMMEVGIADGSSLLAWRDIFPNALCVGMDIHRAARIDCGGDRAGTDRIEFHFGDQRDKADCERVAAGRQFDLIVEDATHNLPDTLLTLLYLWPFVKVGGLYVVEEFANIGALRRNAASLWPFTEIVDTIGPFGGDEPLVVFRRPSV